MTRLTDMKLPIRHSFLAIVSIALFAGRSSAMDADKYFADLNTRALANAAADGDVQAIRESIAMGANPNSPGKDGMTPVIWALIHRNPKGFNYLLAHGGNPNTELVDGKSVMSLAAMLEDSEYLDAALHRGGNPNLPNDQDNHETPIFYAIAALRPNNVRLLIKAKADLNWSGPFGQTPLMFAASVNRYDFAFDMLEAGANPTATDSNGRSILSTIRRLRTDPASEMGSWRAKVIQLLHEKGLDTDNGK